MYDDLYLMIKFCTNVTPLLGQAMDMSHSVPVVKVPNQKVKDMYYKKKDGEISRIPDILFNFRNSKGQDISAIETKRGTKQAPLYIVLTQNTVKQYGIPWIDNEDLYADAVFLDNYWYQQTI
jgi:hypothetical protein